MPTRGTATSTGAVARARSKNGFGIARIDSIVKKCGGYVTRASEDGAFSTEILLPQAVMP